MLVLSGVYETPPWGDADQPAYLNAVLVAADPAAGPRGLAGPGAGAARQAAGRRRDPQRRFGPRTLDVDVIAVWDDDDEPVLSDDAGADPAAPAGAPAGVRAAAVDRHPAVRAELPGAGRIEQLLTRPEVAADVPAVRRCGSEDWWRPENDG